MLSLTSERSSQVSSLITRHVVVDMVYEYLGFLYITSDIADDLLGSNYISIDMVCECLGRPDIALR